MNTHYARGALSFAAIAAVTVPVFFIPACLSSPSTATDSGASSSGGGSSGGVDTGTAPIVCLLPADAGPQDPSCIIDDMTSQSVVSGGYWYTYSDRAFPNTTDIVDGSASSMGVVIATSAGDIVPPEGAEFPPDMTGVGGPPVPGVTGLANFREFSGGGLTLWGAGMGYNWTNVVPPGTEVSDAADAGPALGVPGPFDASKHKGIAFYAKSNNGSTISVGVHFSDARQAAAAGECDATVYVNNPVECGDDYFKNVNFTSSWTNMSVKFSTTTTQNYSGMGLPPGMPELTQLYQVHFQVNNGLFKGTGATDAGAPFDISVAYVTWYDGP